MIKSYLQDKADMIIIAIVFLVALSMYFFLILKGIDNETFKLTLVGLGGCFMGLAKTGGNKNVQNVQGDAQTLSVVPKDNE